MREFAASLKPAEGEEKSITGWTFETFIVRSGSQMFQVYQIFVRFTSTEPLPEAHRPVP
jgi:hypothetical protein